MERLRRFLHPASERKGILDTQRMHANAGSRHGNGTNSRPTDLNSQPNHTRRISHTITTITMIVPTKPKPNISPPSGHMGYQGYPCSDDRPDSGCRLIKTSHITDHRNGICALSDLLCLHYRQPRSTAPAIRGFGEACEPRIKFVKHTPMSYNTCGGAGDFSMFLKSRR